MNKRNTLFQKIARIIAATLFLTLTTMIAILLINQSNSEHDSAVNETENISNVLISSLKFAMANGATDVKPVIENVKSISEISEFRIIPTNIISAGSENKLDTDERAVLVSKTGICSDDNSNGIEKLKKITPILADTSCISCHDSKVGDVLAIVNLQYSLEKMHSGLASQRLISIILGLLTIAFTIMVSMYFISKHVNKPIQKVLYTVKELAKGHVTARSHVKSEDEVGQMAKTVDAMAADLEAYSGLLVKVADGDIAVRSNPFDDEDMLSKSFNAIVDSLKRLVAETNLLINSAQEGNLSIRGRADSFKGGIQGNYYRC